MESDKEKHTYTKTESPCYMPETITILQNNSTFKGKKAEE